MASAHTSAAVTYGSRHGRRFPGRMLPALLIALLLTPAAFLLVRPAAGQDEPAPAAAAARNPQTERRNVEYPFPQRIRVPDGLLDGGAGWLNTSGEIHMKDLRGKVVLLDFWTYCCINCLHVLPDLKFLEEKYPNELVVIGVHSAKFENEKEAENIRNAVMRYNIEHPVVNDSNMRIWRGVGVRAWPTLLVIDAEGNACFMTSGEGKREILDHVIGKLVEYHRTTGTLDETPVRFDLERDKLPPTPLRFPGKVLADESGGRLFISDTNHNRIVVTTLDGKLLEIIGRGTIGADDGPFDQATFDHPQGVALAGDTLYVADTENHLIRAVNLAAKTVSTLAGTGEQSRNLGVQRGPLRRTALNSPWALIHVSGTLYVAMAGPHQVWSHRLGSGNIGVYAGSGREDITDGPLLEAALAQPSAITTDGRFLYIVDSEGSAVRKIPVDPKGKVTTVVGPSNLPNARSLFEFGDVDGVGGNARLQHPLGIVWHNDVLYVADSYNHKIKKVQLDRRRDEGRAMSWLGDGKPGDALDPPQFNEPHGLTIAAGRLYIADTNNHRISVADLQSGAVSVLEIAGLEPPQSTKPAETTLSSAGEAASVDPQRVAAGEEVTFEISLALPQGYKLNTLAPLRYRLNPQDGQTLIAEEHLAGRRDVKEAETTARVNVPLTKQDGKATFDLALTYSYCRDGVGGLCKLGTARWRIPLEVADDADQTVIRLEASPGEK